MNEITVEVYNDNVNFLKQLGAPREWADGVETYTIGSENPYREVGERWRFHRWNRAGRTVYEFEIIGPTSVQVGVP